MIVSTCISWLTPQAEEETGITLEDREGGKKELSQTMKRLIERLEKTEKGDPAIFKRPMPDFSYSYPCFLPRQCQIIKTGVRVRREKDYK